MKKLLLLAVVVFCVSAWGFDADSVISRMNSSGRKTEIGKDPSCGNYVICREDVTIAADVNVAREQAKLKARQTIAELFSVKVTEDSRRTTTTTESVKNEEESFEQQEYFRSVVKKDVKQIQRGISVCKESVSGGKITVYCLLTEQVIDATADLEKAMKRLGPDTVRTTGVGYYDKVVSAAKAHEVALSEAQRNAIAEVLGMSMASSSAKQSVSAESVDNNGEETFACDDTFKSKTFSACAGFVESSRVVDEKTTDSAVFVTIVAKVARDKVMDDYRAYLESMGNPGFCVRSNDPAMIQTYAGFFAGLGLRMVDNVYDAAYLIDAVGAIENGTATVTVTVRDKTAGTTLFSVPNEVNVLSGSSNAATYAKALNGMKTQLHKELDKFIGRANADGRKITVKLCNYDVEYHKKVASIVKNALGMVPGAKNVKMHEEGDEVVYSLNYIGETEDLADFLERHIQTDVKKKANRPKREKVENTLVEFYFE